MSAITNCVRDWLTKGGTQVTAAHHPPVSSIRKHCS